jgi:hypothetical protein
MPVKLSEADKIMLSKIQDATVRAAVEKDLLAAKQVVEDRRNNTRQVFSMKPGKKPGFTTISGLGYQFPTTLPDASWLKILEQAEALRKYIAEKGGPKA